MRLILCVVNGAFLFLSLVFSHNSLASSEDVKDKQSMVGDKSSVSHLKTIGLLNSSNNVIVPTSGEHPVAAMYNREAVIPPQCYTKTDRQHNPCYVCHQDEMPQRENRMRDADLQEAYSFSDLGKTNHWTNLFSDNSLLIEDISDQEIQTWISTDNYSDLAPRLIDAGFKGWIPDLKSLHNSADAFDEDGYAKDGSHWVAFNYKPFPSTFWLTNGASDDVMVRLPAPYRQNEKGDYVRDIYMANLAIVEAKIKDLPAITVPVIDELKVGTDLNGDKQLTQIDTITQIDRYVGGAKDFFIDSYLYPQGTEFLHTVRYLGMTQDDSMPESIRIVPSTRMKEVRYMKKWRAYAKGALARYYEEEAFEKDLGHLPGYKSLGDYGLDNGFGWSVQGFIEGSDGRLRVANHEETVFCMGCHSSIGSTIDNTFSFARKIDGAKGWGYINLVGMPDSPNKGQCIGEFVQYFERAGGGDEFRSNQEMVERWFKNGKVNHQALNGKDVYGIIAPSVARANNLNKAYKAIVDQQTYIFGRDARVSKPKNVHSYISNDSTETLPKDKQYRYDMRLDWPAAE